MINHNVDLGQVIISILIAVIGYVLKIEVSSFKDQLNKHESIILSLVGDVQRLIGRQEAWDKNERRRSNIRSDYTGK